MIRLENLCKSYFVRGEERVAGRVAQNHNGVFSRLREKFTGRG